jgi:hypothetical protein
MSVFPLHENRFTNIETEVERFVNNVDAFVLDLCTCNPKIII